MSTILKYLNQFFTWWANVTKLPTTKYVVAGKEFVVNWPIVSFVVLIWVLMFILL